MGAGDATTDTLVDDSLDAAADSGDPGDTALPSDAGSESDPLDVAPADTDPIDSTLIDSAPPDTDPPDTYVPDTFVPDTYVAPDTGPWDTGPWDTGPWDTGPWDTGPWDTGPWDTGPWDTGPWDTGPADTGVADTAPIDTAPPGPPTVSVTIPALNSSFSFNKLSDVCQSQSFTVSYTAPAGLKSLQWKFITPNAATASTSMVGTCTGAAAYGYFVDPAKYTASTGGSFTEDVAIAGLYSGSAGSGRWWWCTAPGTGSDSYVLSPPAPGTAGVQTLSNYCYAKSTPPSSDLGSRWQLQVTITDAAGNTAIANTYFWVHL